MSKALSAKVMKVLSLFSGLQMLNIVCSVVKMKIVALWMGATGVGLFGIYQSVMDTIASLSDLGLRNSAVRDLSRVRNVPAKLSRLCYIVRRWSTFAGLLGATIIMGASPILGKWFFGTYSSFWGFALLGIAMFCNAVLGGEQAILQANEKFKAMAWANLWGSLTGLALSIPLFYYYGYPGVVLSILVYALSMLFFVRIKRLRVSQPDPVPSLRMIWREGNEFVRLGICMALAAFITSTAHTLFIGILNVISSTAEVGYVQAGDTILVRYVGLIFTAIAMEFYPRISAALPGKPHRVALFVNHEAILLMMLLTPLILLFFLLREPIVIFLYKSDFLVILPFVSWGIISSIPKAVSWCMAYTIIARGEGKIFLLTEGLDACISLPVCLIAYHLFGLTGLGIAYIIWYIIYALIVGFVYYRRYGSRLSHQVIITLSLSFLTVIAALLTVDYAPLPISCPLLLILAVLWLRPLRRLFTRSR